MTRIKLIPVNVDADFLPEFVFIQIQEAAHGMRNKFLFQLMHSNRKFAN
jgi:hypothetical protein